MLAHRLWIFTCTVTTFDGAWKLQCPWWITTTAVTGADAAVTGGQGVTPNGSVGFWVDGQQVGTVPLAADGMASKVVGPFASVGTRTVGVPYYGDIVTTARTGTTTM